jgi:ribosomal protein L11 methylase PrmA
MKTGRATLDSDTALLVAMFDGILSDGEREKLREMREIARTRIDVRIKSMREARDILDRAKHALDEAIVEKARLGVTYDEAMLTLNDDEDDDWETASKKAFKFEKIEAEFLAADDEVEKARKKYNTAMVRVQWELREAERMGYTGNEK